MKFAKGILYWITGLAGAGKSTIGSALYYELRKEQDNVVILDGDILKNLVSGGYSEQERFVRAKKYSNLCKALTDQGITVIICTVAMFEEIRKWNRNHIERYVEVFLDVPWEVLQERDRKGLYSGHKKGQVQNVAGLDVKVDFPQNPDIVIKNDGSMKIDTCVEVIKNYKIESEDSVYRDVDYWNQYYNSHPTTMENAESQFAKEMLKYMKKGKSLIEFGCGNGRDSLFFASKGIKVVGIDISENAIDMLNKVNVYEEARFLCEDFSGENVVFQIQHDYCYSRFTLHAITEIQEQYALQNAWNSIKWGGFFFIEVRSVNDDIYGKGKCVGRHSYIFNNHFRRFIDKNELLEKLMSLGFKIVYAEENKGFAVYGDSNPVLIRVIAQK